MIQTQPRARALLPLLVFLALFIGTGTWLTLQGVEFAFYQLPAPVAAIDPRPFAPARLVPA